MSTRLFGQPIKRCEDPRLLTGRGSYLADLTPPGTLHAAILRSPHAHARLRDVDLAGARRAPGVALAACGRDLGTAARPAPTFIGGPGDLKAVTPTPLALDKVRFAGEAVAAVVAADRYAAEDALERIRVAYEPLAPVVDVRAALEPGAPLVHEDLGTNLGAQWTLKTGDVEAGLARADRVLRERIVIRRGTGGFMETRGVLAAPDAAGRLTVWDSTQSPHLAQRLVAEVLDLAPDRLRFVAPDVGGGFGPKAAIYPEEYLIPWLALQVGRPVKWIEDRREDLLATAQERDCIADIEVGFQRDGALVALRSRVTMDLGAYCTYGLVPQFNVAVSTLGQYKVPLYQVDMAVAYTTRVAVAPLRGAGRPQGAFLMDRAVELAARDLGMDPAEIRFRNLVQPHEFPYRTGLPFRDGAVQTFDSGNYPACLRKALELADYPGLRRRQGEARGRGQYMGIGIGTCVESTGVGPYEGATVRVDPRGRVQLITGSGSQGQGHATSLAQVCADALGVPLEAIAFTAGDTEKIGFGIGTVGSRIATVTAPAVAAAAARVREKALTVAAALLEASRDDLTLEGGKIFVKGSAGRALTLAEVAAAAAGRIATPMPGGVDPGLEATEYFHVKGICYSSGTNVAVVEVDPETGGVKVLRYVVVHDCGRVINPMIVDGQIHGGVVHGLGNALYEDVPFGPDGQPLAATFMDYLIPTAAECPPFDVAHVETPTPLNPLGIKGCGESGTIPAAGALVAAIEDALSPFGVRIRDLPLTPERLRSLVAAAGHLPGPAGGSGGLAAAQA